MPGGVELAHGDGALGQRLELLADGLHPRAPRGPSPRRAPSTQLRRPSHRPTLARQGTEGPELNGGFFSFLEMIDLVKELGLGFGELEGERRDHRPPRLAQHPALRGDNKLEFEL